MIVFAALILATRLSGTAKASPLAGLFTNADGTPCKLPFLFQANGMEARVRPGAQSFGGIHPDDCLVYILARVPHDEPDSKPWCGFIESRCKHPLDAP